MKFKSDAIERVIYKLLLLVVIFSWLGAGILLAVIIGLFSISIYSQTADMTTTFILIVYLIALGINMLVASFLQDVRKDMLVKS